MNHQQQKIGNDETAIPSCSDLKEEGAKKTLSPPTKRADNIDGPIETHASTIELSEQVDSYG